MDTDEISARLHDILRAACRVHQAGPGCTAEASVENIDQVKRRLRALITDLGDQEAPHLPPRLQACAAAFPEGRIAGTRAVVQHRRRMRGKAGERGAAQIAGHFRLLLEGLVESQHTATGAGRPTPDDRYASRARNAAI